MLQISNDRLSARARADNAVAPRLLDGHFSATVDAGDGVTVARCGMDARLR